MEPWSNPAETEVGPGVTPPSEIGPGVGPGQTPSDGNSTGQTTPVGPGYETQPGQGEEAGQSSPEGSEEGQMPPEDGEVPPPAEEVPPQPVLQPAPSVTYLADGLYIEPDYTAGTNLVDYFSTSSQIRAQLNFTEKTQRRLTEEAEKLVTDFEDTTIDSVEDVPEIRQMHETISEKLNQLEDGETRKALFDRTEVRWQEFSQIMDSMADSIRVYDGQQELEREQARRQADQQAELLRKEEETRIRVETFETALQMVESIQYRSADANTLITTAIEKLGDLYGYTETATYRARLEAAIERIRNLPTRNQWNAYQAQQKAKDQQELYRLYQTEQYYWTDTPSQGPGVR